VNHPRIADLFTLANLTAGCLSILSEAPMAAAGFILLGAFFDLFDGMVARWMKQASPLGVQLDSLADMVTFGVAPAMLFLQMLPPGPWALGVALLIPAASAWRLAVFNLLPPSPVFLGLPTPANALWYAALSLWLPGSGDLPEMLREPCLHLVLSLGLSAFMVSRIEVPSFKAWSALRRRPWAPVLAVAGGVTALLAGHPALGPSAALSGALLGILMGSALSRDPENGDERQFAG